MKFSFRNVVKVTVAGIGAAALAMIVFMPRQSQNANAAADAAATYKASWLSVTSEIERCNRREVLWKR